MFSYLFMKLLEGSPRTYERWMRAATRGRHGRLREAVAARVPPASRVLEIGCGPGELAVRLAAAGCRVLALEPDRGMVRVAAARIASAGLAERVTVRAVGVEGMETLPAGSFDAVVSVLVLGELCDGERSFALREAARLLAPGGIFLAAEEVVPRQPLPRLFHALLRLPAVALTYLVAGAGSRPLRDLPLEARAAGLRVVKEETRSGGAMALLVARRPVGGP